MHQNRMQLKFPINLKSLDVIGSIDGTISINVCHGDCSSDTRKVVFVRDAVFKVQTLEAMAGEFQGHSSLKSEIQTASTIYFN